MNIARLPIPPLYIGYGDQICKKLAILYTSGVSPTPPTTAAEVHGSSTLLKQLYTETIAFAKCFVALRDAGNLFTFGSLASHFTVIVLLAALDCAALSWDSCELRWVGKGMFWSVGASGYHQDREKQHKSFHNWLHLVNVHPAIRDSRMELSAFSNQRSVWYVVFTCILWWLSAS